MTATLPISLEPLACEDVAPLVSERIDGELEPRTAMRVELHLATCPACARFARELAATVAALHAMKFRWPSVRVRAARGSRALHAEGSPIASRASARPRETPPPAWGARPSRA